MTAYKIERNAVKTTKQGQVITYPCFTLSINSFKKRENKACGLGGNRSLLSVNEDLRLTA